MHATVQHPAAPLRLRDRLRAITDSRHFASFLCFLVIGLIVRMPMLGNPMQHIDEQFYLLVADRMGQGALPYVDIWDRKPIGLFLIYRLALLLPMDPVLASQTLGLASAVATAMVMERIAEMFTSGVGPRRAACAYLVLAPIFANGFAQAPVFYNLPVALAAWLVIRAWTAPAGSGLLRRGLVIMALLGLAIQIKYTVVFEGFGLGLILLAKARADGASLPRLAGYALAWAGVAVAPTAAVWAWYAQAGHNEAFFFANFLSIFGKTQGDNRELLRLGQMLLILSPLLCAVLLSRRPDRDPRALLLARLWALSSALGYLAFGKWYDHYIGPVLPPLAVVAAPFLSRERVFNYLLFAAAIMANIVTAVDRQLKDGSPADAERARVAIAAELDGGCLYQYQGMSVFYRLTDACLATRYIFPDHLATAPEATAVGVNVAAEVRRIMASRPAVVLVDDDEKPYMPNHQTRAIVDAALARDYVKLGQIHVGVHRLGFWRIRR